MVRRKADERQAALQSASQDPNATEETVELTTANVDALCEINELKAELSTTKRELSTTKLKLKRGFHTIRKRNATIKSQNAMIKAQNVRMERVGEVLTLLERILGSDKVDNSEKEKKDTSLELATATAVGMAVAGAGPSATAFAGFACLALVRMTVPWE